MAQEPRSSAGSRIVLLLVVYWLLLLTYVPTRGIGQVYSFAAVLAAVVLLSAIALGWTGRLDRFFGKDARYALGFTAVLSAVLGVVYYFSPTYSEYQPKMVEGLFWIRDLSQRATQFGPITGPGGEQIILEMPFKPAFALGLLIMAFGAGLTALFFIPEPSSEGALPRAVRWASQRLVWLIIGAVVLARICMFAACPKPYIDVFVNSNEGAQALLQGRNPYTAQFTQVYTDQQLHDLYGSVVKDYYPYFPGVLLLTAPFRAVFGDVRYALLFAELLAAILLIKISAGLVDAANRPEARRLGELAALALILNPRGPFMLEQAWIEPLLVALLAGMAYLVAVKRKPIAGAVLAGILLSTKQYMVLLPLFMLRLKEKRLPSLALSIGIGAVITLPFLLWDPAAMISDTIGIFLKLVPRYDSITLWGLLQNAFLVEIPTHGPLAMVLGALPILLGAAIGFWKQRPGIEGVMGGLAISLLWSFFFSKQAFINYYYLVGAILLIQVALLAPETLKADTEPAERIAVAGRQGRK